MTRLAALALVAAAMLAGCGNSTQDQSAADKPTIRNPAPWTEQQVMDAAGLTTKDGGITYQTSSGCEVSVVLTSAAAVNTYADAGDTVVTNPGGTAGVKTSGDEPACLKEFQRGLSTLRK